ncbi:MAG: hypothetical protein KF830_04995 [Planctomycetes bacterium]|nr:hypothetical protein [Planctomycetota bacterium]
MPMLDVLFAASLAFALPQAPHAVAAAAVAVRGDTELTAAEAYASACRRAEEHVRTRWSDRARAALARRPFWVPAGLAERTVGRWIDDLPLAESLRLVDRDDREREHEFGHSYQTTLWVVEEPDRVGSWERLLREHLRQLEQSTALRFGGIAGAWVLLALTVGWLDRLSRGYMTGLLRGLGLAAAAAVPAITFLL